MVSVYIEVIVGLSGAAPGKSWMIYSCYFSASCREYYECAILQSFFFSSFNMICSLV